jgi:hypothetical protein
MEQDVVFQEERKARHGNVVMPIKNNLLEEIGNDCSALEAFDLFHSHDFTKLITHWIENNQNMSAENAERFKGLLIAIAPMLVPDYMSAIEPEILEQEEDIQKIIAIVGGDRMAIRKDAIKFPQFCFEMVFCAMSDTHLERNPVLSQSCECVCECICDELEWDGNDKAAELIRIVGWRGDEGGFCDPAQIWPNWRA